MTLSPEVLVAVVASVLGGGMAIPQVVSLFRNRNAGGVSASWAAASAAVNAWWIAYGLGTGDLAIVPVSAFSVMAYVAIAIGILVFSTEGRSRIWRQLLTGAAVALIPLPVTLTMGWEWTGIALGALYAVQLSPAVYTVYRTHDVSGVAAGTWVLAWLEAVLWGAYALPTIDVGLLALATTGLVMSSLVLARLYFKRPRRSRDRNIILAR